MAECRFLCYAVPEGPPYYANGAYKAVTKCETHNHVFEGAVCGPVCPVGRLERLEERVAALEARN